MVSVIGPPHFKPLLMSIAIEARPHCKNVKVPRPRSDHRMTPFVIGSSRARHTQPRCFASMPRPAVLLFILDARGGPRGAARALPPAAGAVPRAGPLRRRHLPRPLAP